MKWSSDLGVILAWSSAVAASPTAGRLYPRQGQPVPQAGSGPAQAQPTSIPPGPFTLSVSDVALFNFSAPDPGTDLDVIYNNVVASGGSLWLDQHPSGAMCGNASAPLTPCQFPVDQGYAEGIELGPPNDFTYFVAHGDGTLLLNTSNVNGPNKQQVTIGEDLSLQYNVGIVGAGGSTSSDGGQGTSGGWQSQSVSPTPGAGWKIPVLIPPTNVMNAQGLNFLACPVPDPGSGSKYYKLYVSHNVASPAPAVAARQVSGPILGPRPGLAPTFDVTACYSVALDIIGPGPLDRFVVPVAYD